MRGDQPAHHHPPQLFFISLARPLHIPYSPGQGAGSRLSVGLQCFECPGQLVGATCSSGFAVDALEACDDIRFLHACDEGRQSLSISVTALGVLDFPDDVALEFDIDLDGADGLASLEGSLPDAVFGRVG